MKLFYTKEFVLWSIVVIFALVVIYISPFSVWDSLPFGILFIGLLLYFRQSVELFRGDVVSKNEVMLSLPAHQSFSVNVEKVKDVNLVFHLKNISFLFLSGHIMVTKPSGECLGRIDLPKPAGRAIRNIFGKEQVLGPPGKTQPRIRTKQLVIKDNQMSQLNVELDLAWNFEGWNTHWERSLPTDRKLHLEYLVKAI